MQSYDVVMKAIEFSGPDRLPCEFESLGISDTKWISWNQIGAGDNRIRETLDEWGCKWVRTGQSNMGQIKGHPLHSWSMLDHYHWPDPYNPGLYNDMESEFEDNEEKYVLTGIFMLLFERMHSLRSFENTLTDLYLERENIEYIADRNVELDIEMI